MYGEDPETTNWRQLHKEKKMKKVLYTVVALTGAMLVAPAAFAQTTTAPAGGTNWVAISAAFGMALAAFGGAMAQSRITRAPVYLPLFACKTPAFFMLLFISATFKQARNFLETPGVKTPGSL